MWGKVIRYAEVTSTNDLARDHARLGVGEGTALQAAHQSAGRGRLGRVWEAPANRALLCSVILRPPAALAHSAWLTLIGGVAVAEALREHCDQPGALKWPNDVRLDGRKVAGILTETVREGDACLAILGLGLNVNQTPEEFSPEILGLATSLRLTSGREWEVNELLDEVLRHLRSAYNTLLEGDIEALRRHWLELDETVGRQVIVDAPDGQWRGRAATIDEHGALWIEDAVGDPRRIVVGDVSIRFED